MSKHNRERRAAFKAALANTPTRAVHMNGSAVPVVSPHDIRNAPAGTEGGMMGDLAGPRNLTEAIRCVHATLKNADEPPSKKLPAVTFGEHVRAATKQLPGGGWQQWECAPYYGSVRRYATGFPIGNGPFVVIGISSLDETARHDWRDFQHIKNQICGEEWEAVELYPAESRLKDPSNRFYLWCTPKGVFNFGFVGRTVQDHGSSVAPQRPFPKEPDTVAHVNGSNDAVESNRVTPVS